MSIIYSLITRQNKDDLTILCSYDMANGNYPTICQQVLKNAKITQNKIYNYNNQYNFHILKDKDENILYVCMASSVMKNKLVFAFLQEIKKQFREKYTKEQIEEAKDYDMSAGFSEIYKNQIGQNFYNTNAGKRDRDNKDVLMKELNSLQEIMSENIDKVLQNEERVQMIVKKAAKTHTIAEQIKLSASKMKKDAFLKRHKFKIIVLVLIIAIGIGLYFMLRKPEPAPAPA